MAEPDDPNSLPTQQWTGAPAPGPPSPLPAVSDSALEGLLGARSPSRSGPWQPPTPEELQHSFPQYEIREVLGRGGMGAVYKAWQKNLDRFVAIKILPPQMEEADASFAQRFKREAKAMARLKHPGIVAVYDAGETSPSTSSGQGEKLLYFIMEYIEGTDVQQLVAKEGRLPPVQAVAITSRVCEALAYAHENGIIHRDIKPSNIMIESDGRGGGVRDKWWLENGRVKVADFGLAKTTAADSTLLTGVDMAMGTPDFMAPEALRGAAQVDHRADLYAVGVMLYQMLTGELPRGRFLPPSRAIPGLDKRLDKIVDRSLQPDRASRYSSATELRSALEPVRAKSSALAAAAPSYQLRLPPTTMLVSLAAILLLFGGLAWSLVHGNKTGGETRSVVSQNLPDSDKKAGAGGGEHAPDIANRPEITVRMPSARGEIRDRNGITLATNRPSNEVQFYFSDIVNGYERKFGPAPTIEYMAKVGHARKKVVEPDIVKIVNDAVLPKLKELGLARDYDAEALRDHYRNRAVVPFTYQEEVDAWTIAKFSEHLAELPGVKIAVKPVRKYVYGALAAHLLGYVGDPLDIRQLPDLGKYTVYQPDAEGKSQIEYSMDEYLRGDAGTRVLRKNARDMTESEERVNPPKPGDDVYLTIDARIQYIVEQALRHPQLGRAAAVVVDPNNGEILAMASVPSFDPNAIVAGGSKEALQSLRADPALPLSSRAVSAFPPAHTFKIVTALAGLAKKTKDADGTEVSSKMEDARFNCAGRITYGDQTLRCWIDEKGGTHGTIGLADALMRSCDCFFYQYANATGIESIDRIGKTLGLGEHFDLGLQDQKDGVMPGPQWLKTDSPELKWTSASTAITAIGQGYVLATPLQMAMAYAVVANGGISYGPRLIKQVLTPEGKPVLDEKAEPAVPDRPTIRGDLRAELTKEQFEVVRHGLWQVVNDDGGTGAKARVTGMTVAGKTGSTQATEADWNKEETIAWFCCFAPFEKPRYAICAMVEGGLHGGSVAAPIAGHILQQIFAMEQGASKVELTALTPAHNPDPLKDIDGLSDYEHPTIVPVASVEEPATAQHTSNAKVQMGADSTQPQPPKQKGHSVTPPPEPEAVTPASRQPHPP